MTQLIYFETRCWNYCDKPNRDQRSLFTIPGLVLSAAICFITVQDSNINVDFTSDQSPFSYQTLFRQYVNYSVQMKWPVWPLLCRCPHSTSLSTSWCSSNLNNLQYLNVFFSVWKPVCLLFSFNVDSVFMFYYSLFKHVCYHARFDCEIKSWPKKSIKNKV